MPDNSNSEHPVFPIALISRMPDWAVQSVLPIAIHRLLHRCYPLARKGGTEPFDVSSYLTCQYDKDKTHPLTINFIKDVLPDIDYQYQIETAAKQPGPGFLFGFGIVAPGQLILHPNPTCVKVRA